MVIAVLLYINLQRIDGKIDENGKFALNGNQLKLDYIWGQLMIKVNFLLFYNICIIIINAMLKGKKLANSKGNAWNGSKTGASISGLKATVGPESHQYVFATEGFAISGDQCRKDNFPFPGTIVFYYEVTVSVGFGW
jgi:hypothetical protein